MRFVVETADADARTLRGFLVDGGASDGIAIHAAEGVIHARLAGAPAPRAPARTTIPIDLECTEVPRFGRWARRPDVAGTLVEARTSPAASLPHTAALVRRLGRSEAPWRAELAADERTARAILARHRPDLAEADVAPFGQGWDNALYLAQTPGARERWVLRLPRRQIAVGLIARELEALAAIAPRVPLPVPNPERIDADVPGYAAPCLRYRLLPGRTADRADLTRDERARLAAPLGGFLRALHDVEAPGAIDWGDELMRTDTARQLSVALARLRPLRATAHPDAAGAYAALVAAFDALPAAPAPAPAAPRVVHGDLYARHLLVDDAAQLAGVIDWGDVHRGDPAVDLAIVPAFLPPEAHDDFTAAYGAIDAPTWARARLRAVGHAISLLAYGAAAPDEALCALARLAFHHARS